MTLTFEQLKACAPAAAGTNRIKKFLDPINKALAEFDISTPLRVAGFLAQVIHESGSFVYMQELASGDAYDTRVDLGNTPEKDGDGRKWKGHGLIQITGATNHKLVAKYFGIPLDKVVAWILTPEGAARSAGWYWTVFRKINAIADKGDIKAMSIAVNGKNRKTGLPNHLPERTAIYNNCKKVLGIK